MTSRSARKQAAALKKTSSALEEITTAGQRIDRSRSGSQPQGGTKRAAARKASGAIVGDAVSAMERIETASGQISQIITVIDEIAFQTNLLALNCGCRGGTCGGSRQGLCRRGAGSPRACPTLRRCREGHQGAHQPNPARRSAPAFALSRPPPTRCRKSASMWMPSTTRFIRSRQRPASNRPACRR